MRSTGRRSTGLAPLCTGFALALASAVPSQSRDERAASVGMRAVVEQVVFPGSELVPAPSTSKTPVVVRVLKVWPHGEHRRYDLEWTGFEVGRYDLGAFLVRKDGSPIGSLPPLPIEVTGSGSKELVEPSELQAKPAPRLHGYRTIQIAVGIAWGVGLLAILFVGRRFRRRAPPPPPPPTLADRLRPLVERVAGGSAETAEKAELERLLVAFWRARLDLREHKAGDALGIIRNHPEAGALVRQLEAWLHMPKPPTSFDLQALLQPYRSVTAASFEPPTDAGGR